MKELKKSDLKVGEIYIAQYKERNYQGKYIVKINNNMLNCFNIYTNIKMLYRNGIFSNVNLDFYEATPEEKHWLETCIKADKFVSYEEAMKTFVPEYVEFVLPEIWWVRITKENLEDVSKFLGFKPSEKGIGNIVGMCKNYRTGNIQKGWNATPTTIYGSTFGNEITTEQFRKYVLKIEDENTSKFIDDTTVINKEGEVFKVGDVIKSINSNLKDKIIDFRWKNDKSEICAVLPNIPNGIGIDKIELYVEPKVKPKQELSLLEQAKLKYPIGTKFKNAYKGVDRGIQIIDDYPLKEANLVSHGRIGVYWRNEWLYFNDQWAEIVDDFVLPEKWYTKITSENKDIINHWRRNIIQYHNSDCQYETISQDGSESSLNFMNECKSYQEITFEQFKKYVLNEKI